MNLSWYGDPSYTNVMYFRWWKANYKRCHDNL